MKKFILNTTLSLGLMLGLGSQTAFAHVLKSSGSVGAVVHVTPEDDPIAGESSEFFFEFKDKENKFKPTNCDCKVTVLQSGKEVYTTPLFQNNANPSLNNASFAYTFPQRDVYKLKIIGKPTSADSFQPFTLEYDIRVSRVSDKPLTSSSSNSTASSSPILNWIQGHIPHTVGGILVVFIFVYMLIKQRNNDNKAQKGK